MPYFKKVRTLRSKLLAAFLLLDLAALALIIRIASRDTYGALEGQIQLHLSHTMKEHSDSIAQELETKWRWLIRTADNPFIVDSLVHTGGRARYLLPFMRQLTLPGRGGEQPVIMLLDSRGRVIADNMSDGAPSADFSKDNWFRDVMRYGDSRAELTVGTENTAVLFACPVFVGENPAGVLAAEFHLDFVSGILTSEKAFQASLLTPSGRVILGELPKSEAESIAALPGDPDKPRTFIKDGMLYSVGSLRAPVEAGLEQLLVLSAPLREINKPIQALRWRMLLIGIMIAVVLAFMIFWLSGALLKPLKTLEETMEHVVQEGDLSRRAPVTGQDEVGVLSAVFNRMLDSLAEKNRQLTLLAGITSTSPLPIMLVDENMKIQVWNEAAEKLFGWRREEILGHSPFEALVPEEEQEVIRRLRAKTDQSGGARYDTTRLTRDGERLPVESISTRLNDSNGRFMGNIVIYRDLREIRKLQESVLQSEKMGAVGQLAAGVAHEINNPLGIILGFAQSLVKRIKKDDPMAMPLKSIEREAVRCKNLVQDLLVFSRSSATEKGKLDLNAALDGALSLILARAKTQGVEIIRELSPALPPVTANGNKIQQALINLANNALDAMPKGGVLTIGTALSGNRPGYVRIRVQDNGHGIPKEIQAKVMEPFFTTKEAGKGTGLGLALVYEIVKNHNGSIELESEEGKGTRFTIFLPTEAVNPR